MERKKHTKYIARVMLCCILGGTGCLKDLTPLKQQAKTQQLKLEQLQREHQTLVLELQTGEQQRVLSEAVLSLSNEVVQLQEQLKETETEIETLTQQNQAFDNIPHGYEKVRFRSGADVACRVSTYENGTLTLTGASGKEKRGSIRLVEGILFRQADVEPTEFTETRQPEPRQQTTEPKPFNGPYRIEVDMVRSKASKSIDRHSGFLDEERQDIQFTIKVKSEEMTSQIYENLNAKVYVITRHVQDKDNYILLIKESKDFSVAPFEEFVFETKEAYTEYDDERSGQYGYKYYGYLLRIFDAKGNMLIEKASRNRLIKSADTYTALTEGNGFRL